MKLSKEKILITLKKHAPKIESLGVIKIGLFGSYVREEQTKQSDIDIFVEFDPQKESFDNFMDLCFMLDDMFKNKKVEVVTKNGLSPYIGPKILKEVEYVALPS
jgi:hypothetical protein